MGVVQEFREFIARGNVIDLAVGVIIGAAFNSIVKSLVDQVVMPPIGLVTGGLDFSKLEWVLRRDDPSTEAVEKVAVMYGAFVNTIIQFLITAFAVFLLVKVVNAIRRQQAADPAPTAPPAPTPSEALLIEIRDLLSARAPAPASAPAPATSAAVKPSAAKSPAPKAASPKASRPAAPRKPSK